jgi:hypothetical protein
MEGQITLDRAIKHIANRAAVKTDSGLIAILNVESGPTFKVATEFEAVMLMESKWDELEAARVRKRARKIPFKVSVGLSLFAKPVRGLNSKSNQLVRRKKAGQ